jgi:hypothetical protein
MAIGCGKSTKKELNGVVSNVQGKDIEKLNITRFDQVF